MSPPTVSFVSVVVYVVMTVTTVTRRIPSPNPSGGSDQMNICSTNLATGPPRSTNRRKQQLSPTMRPMMTDQPSVPLHSATAGV